MDESFSNPSIIIPPSGNDEDPSRASGPSATVSDSATPPLLPDPPTLLATQGVLEEEDLTHDPNLQRWLADRGLLPEDFDAYYGLLAPEDTVIIRPYGGEDDDILLQELRPRFVVMYEPNLAFIRRLEVCSAGVLHPD
jgi:DNA excision repair protein ERCC-4